MKISNFNQLATTPLRAQGLKIIAAGLEAIDTKNVINKEVKYDAGRSMLTVSGHKFDISKYERVIAIGFGKAAFDAVAELQAILGKVISCGFVLDIKEGSLEGISCSVGSHPYPTIINVEATDKIIEMLSQATVRDLVLCVVSGGGSSLLCSPKDLTCEQESEIISVLTKKGASILELNTVRKHISRVKGGNLAVLCRPATMVNLIFSDVPGDDIGLVASGPTVLDTTTVHDARAILHKYNVLAELEWDSLSLHETPKDPSLFENIHNILLVTGQTALTAMKIKAEELGWPVSVVPHYSGEAKAMGEYLFLCAAPGKCLIAGGESTVVITGSGTGGRNQELALNLLPKLKDGQLVLAVATDGHDNSDVAGSLADTRIAHRARLMHEDPKLYLDENDSYHFFEKVGGHIITGHTGSNAADLVVVMKEKQL